ncbi:hypothetical protein C8A00DRAFT_15087 [Chaetomidium leptoderma]|uniref:Transcription factor RfeG n=1 Tax=Chaetomidium leptoderma TaxID=669021 RepID=A0AAN6VNT5_9PEZI|nr:hypothetical protein C8A00DRAFT_15087 [Chaetomidium leptoderma]
MAGRPSNRTSQQAMPPASARQNEYFVPRDGIDREVITSDICRYLGNDALVRPGTYDSPDGRATQGYFITAYRNLTSAMIQDLKSDSARWEQERRAASRSGGGTTHSSQPNAVFVRRNSNSPIGSRDQARGQDYNAWKNNLREQREYAPSYETAMDIDYAPAAGAAANQGFANQQYQGQAPPANYHPAAYPPPIHAAASPQYAGQPGYGYPPNPPPTQYSPQPQLSGDRYSAIPPPPIPVSYAQDTGAFVHGSNYQTAGGYATAGPNRIPPNMPLTSAAPSRNYNLPTAGTPGFGNETDPYGYPPAGNPVGQAYPTDTLYGRGTTQRPGYVAPPEPQYDLQNPGLQSAPPTTTSPTSPAQLATAGAPPPRRERDSEPRERERERDHRDHRARRPEPERDDRHADRNRRHR